MSIRPRWRKVISDLWGNKSRSLLVVASIAVGLFAVGIIVASYDILSEDMRTGYSSTNPANIQILSDSFDGDLVDQIKDLQGVKDAEGICTARLRLKTQQDGWITLQVKAFPDFDQTVINQVSLEQGVWPPDFQEIVIERFKLADTYAGVGDKVEIEALLGSSRQLEVVGVVQDQTIGAGSLGGGFFLAPVQGYIDMETAEWLGIAPTFNQLYVTVSGDSNDEDYINQIAARVRDRVERSGALIYSTSVQRSNDHPNSTYVDATAGVLFLLGLLVVFLSGFLITSTLSALMAQQVGQIGVMKTVGGQQSQIMGIYMMLIFIYGGVAFAIAMPLSQQAGYALMDFMSESINISLQGYRVAYPAIYLQVLIALIVPQVAAFVPIWRGARLTVQEAISGYRQSQAALGKSSFDRWLARLRGISRPMLISLRNAFRRKGRLLLTMTTLSLGGAIFIATFNVQVSLSDYIDRVSRYFLADVNLTLDRPYRIERVAQELSALPGVGWVEGWAEAASQLILEDGSAGDSILLIGPPADSILIEPILLSGRWIQPGDENAIVLSELFQARFPDLKPGDTLRLLVDGDETDWVVVGFFQLAGKSGGFLAYTNYDYLSYLTNQPDKASLYRVVSSTAGLSEEGQEQLKQDIEAHLRQRGYRMSELSTGLLLRSSSSEGLNVLTIFLLIMASLTALVGSIGLAGTMSMNVMERTREIGVMRAIGASDGILMRMVLAEGMIIGLASWLLGSLLAFPISKLMSDTVSQALFDAPSDFGFTLTGFLIWLGAVLVLSAFASLLPARTATRLTIREVLAYE
jgi:putative ABC transport system permease protein